MADAIRLITYHALARKLRRITGDERWNAGMVRDRVRDGRFPTPRMIVHVRAPVLTERVQNAIPVEDAAAIEEHMRAKTAARDGSSTGGQQSPPTANDGN